MLKRALLSIFLLASCPYTGQQPSPPVPPGGHVEVVKSPDGWRLMVNGKPFFVKGMCLGLSKVGESAHENTQRDWMDVDDDHNGRNDFAYQAWVDTNRNNQRDPGEAEIGDFQLWKDMGVNAVRFYHHPSADPEIQAINPGKILMNHAPNKKLLRELYQKFGIRVAMADLLGAYTVGSGAPWDPGTDYRDKAQRANMLKSVAAMVKDFKDEPYILMWMLGNENNYAKYTHTNAEQYPEEYAKFVNEAAKLIHSLDPHHPVCLVNGGKQFLDVYAKHAPAVDIFGLNDYKMFDFGNLWSDVAGVYDKPVLLTEFGTGYPPIENGILREDKQAAVHKSCWLDIARHAAGKQTPGNSIGGFVFVWLDDWWQSGNPLAHDIAKDGWSFEWNGMAGQGDGTQSPFLRELRKVYSTYKDLWQGN